MNLEKYQLFHWTVPTINYDEIVKKCPAFLFENEEGHKSIRCHDQSTKKTIKHMYYQWKFMILMKLHFKIH